MLKKSSVQKRRLYYFTSATWAIENVVLKRLKISDINSLNDPYELSGYIVDDEKKETIRLFKEFVSGSYGIICFSNSYQSPLMWSHYADRHRGICLGFDVHEDNCFDVFYSDSMIEFQEKFKRPVNSFTLEDLQKILSLKYIEWKQEDECRIFSPIANSISQDGFSFEQFGKIIQLKEIIFGVQNNSDQASLEKFISQYYEDDIKISRAVLDSKKFQVNIVDDNIDDRNLF